MTPEKTVTARERAAPEPEGRLLLLLLAVVLLGGAWLRLHRLMELPPGPWIDEAYALRAAREATAAGFGRVPASLPLQPPGTPFVNFWLTAPVLLFLSAVDRLAGGGIAAFRLVSTLPALVVMAGAALLAWEVLRPRRGAALLATFLVASSSWLLSTARWGWVANLTSAFLVLSAFVALRAARAERRSGAILQAAGAGLLLGVAQYGYPSAWLLVPLPLVLLGASLRTAPAAKRRLRVETAAAGALGFLLAAGPLAAHYAAHPERAAARPKELSIARAGAVEAARKVTGNVVAYARLFVLGGDPNERHGEPGRPILPVVAAGLATIGIAAALRDRRLALVASAALLVLAGGLLAGSEEPNSFRISAAAPFLAVLAAAGAAAVVDRLPEGARRRGTGLGAAVLVVSGAIDAAGFLSWLASPRLRGAFGGPERELADAIRGQVASRRATGVLLDPRAVRNPWVVDVLLASPSGGGRKALAWGLVAPASMERVTAAGGAGRAILIAAPAESGSAGAVRSAGGQVVAASAPLDGFPGWVLYRVGTVSAEPPRDALPAPPTAPR